MQEIISYGYVLEYARNYDNEWRKMLQNLIKAIIMLDPNIFCKNFGGKSIEEDLSHPGKKCLKSFISRHIPDECIFQSMQFMSCKDLVSASVVCSQWYKLSQKKELWENLLLKCFHINLESFNLSNKIKNGSTVQKRKKISPAKLAYRMMYQSLLNIVSENYGSSLRQVPSVPSSFLYY
jgi:hypothetical protein